VKLHFIDLKVEICQVVFSQEYFERNFSTYDTENDETLKTLTLTNNLEGNDYFE